jgi:Leucine-rich repeat (LRR) protein
MVAKRPEDRHPSMAAVIAALQAAGPATARTDLVSALPAGKHPPAAWAMAQIETDLQQRTAAPSSRSFALRRPGKRWWVAAALVVGAALVAGLAFRRAAPPAVTHPAPLAIRRAPPSGPSSNSLDAAWLQAVARLPGPGQVDAVTRKLRDLNPGFTEVPAAWFDGGAVVRLEFSPRDVADLSPLRALPSLQRLRCRGTGKDPGKISDLSALRGLPLTWLDCSHNPITDLTPLSGMSLKHLSLHGTKIRDLKPLLKLRLDEFHCGETPVEDLSSLQNMPLILLSCWGAPVRDLSPLRRMKTLKSLHCFGTKVTDLTPLSEVPLVDLRFNYNPERDRAALLAIKTLKKINDQSMEDFRKQ